MQVERKQKETQQMKHTPGPWEARESPRSNDVWYVEGPSEPNGKWLIAEANGRNQTNEANSRLISAAPDLLEALKLIVNLHGGTITVAQMQLAFDAIAKAEGRTHE